MPTLPNQDQANTAEYLQKVLGFQPVEADILAQLYIMAVYYKVNLSVLVPVLEGLIHLSQDGSSGRIVINTGIDKGHRYFTVEMRKTIRSTNQPLDVT